MKLIASLVLIFALAFPTFAGSSALVEWSRYAKNITNGVNGSFAPSAGYKCIHPDELDAAVNGPLAAGEMPYLVFIFHFTDGTQASCGAWFPQGATTDYITVPKADWEPSCNQIAGLTDGKKITGIDYGMGTKWSGPPGTPQASIILQVNGFEYNANEP
jgi:hypothetical protein